ncbi:hypothetical protein SNE40_003016 [Patella caerulea]|uniref:Flavin-containing monooxygenase n=1 Tax=Patella caerulea TaxID=87958 RepID=A0AAN8QEQ0_PATCE
MPSEKKHICIIGAGASGLGCLRYFTENQERFTVVAYEQGSRIGGTWIYSDHSGSDKNGRPIHSSMYKSLVINIPKQIMAFPDFPFDSDLPSFFGHREVLKYLEKYTEHFRLLPYIRFNTRVLMVKPRHIGDGLWGTKWNVNIEPSNNSHSSPTANDFDAVIVCTGQYAVPNIPDYPGLKKFKGTTIHSHSYRSPDIFRDKTVLTIGASFSGWDITTEVASLAQYVYFSHRGEHKLRHFPKNVELVSRVEGFTKNAVILANGSQVAIDAVVFNTGYKHNFSFLSPDCGFEVTPDNTIRHLYKHTINIANPTLSFISILNNSLPFPCISILARYFKAVLEEQIRLPSRKGMLLAEQEELQKRLDRNWPPRYLHRMEDFQFEMCDEIAKEVGIEPLPRWIKKLFDYHIVKLFENIHTAKKYNYRIIEPDGFEIVP